MTSGFEGHSILTITNIMTFIPKYMTSNFNTLYQWDYLWEQSFTSMISLLAFGDAASLRTLMATAIFTVLPSGSHIPCKKNEGKSARRAGQVRWYDGYSKSYII